MVTTTTSGIGLAWKYFGRLTIDGKTQSLAEFRDEVKKLTDTSKAELTQGLSDGTLTYPDRPEHHAQAA
jgi:hypothetical protein